MILIGTGVFCVILNVVLFLGLQVGGLPPPVLLIMAMYSLVVEIFLINQILEGFITEGSEIANSVLFSDFTAFPPGLILVWTGDRCITGLTLFTLISIANVVKMLYSLFVLKPKEGVEFGSTHFLSLWLTMLLAWCVVMLNGVYNKTPLTIDSVVYAVGTSFMLANLLVCSFQFRK